MMRRIVRDILPEQKDLPTGERHETVENVHERRLARPVRTYDGQLFSWFHTEGYIVQSPYAAETLGYPFSLKYCFQVDALFLSQHSD